MVLRLVQAMATIPVLSHGFRLWKRTCKRVMGMGHGPDPGSLEWRSVVEFKLGIRGDAAIPPQATDRWCEYIDEYLDAELWR